MNGVFASLDIEDSDLRAHASHRMPGDARATDWRLSVLIDFKDDTALPVAIPQPAIIDDSLSRLQSLQQKRNGLFVWKLLGGFLIGLGVFCWFEAEGLNGVFGILIIYLGQICYNHGDKLVSATRKSPLSLGSISRRMKLKFAWTALSFCLIGLGILCLYGVAILGVEPINQAWIFVALVYLGTVCLRPKIHVSLSFLEKSARLAGKAFGIVLIALSGLGLVEPLLRGPGSVLFAAASFPCFYLAKTCYVRAKKMGGMDALEALASDPRKPVLYLRPFREDELAAQRGKTFLRLRSEEEALAKVMNEIGPFICVGKPNESLSEVGAFRMYMSEEKW